MPELAVDGAVLHYRLRGTGPLLLVSQSGEGDADRSTDLVDALAGAFTVLTYDRRGLSRSRTAEGREAVTVAEHVDDVHRLLAALTDRPVPMLGCSLGAVIGLHLAARHPGQLSTLIAHEPVAPWLLGAAERAHHEAELAELQELYVREGLAAVLPEIARVLRIDTTGRDAEANLTPQPMDARRRANFDVFLRHDFTALLRDDLGLDALAASPVRIVPAAGATTPAEVFDRRCADALAVLVGAEVAEFPGGHNGNTSHPRAYAARVIEILA
ncbi:alpha/beta fold hydrolase [Kitasatospora sp. NPDC051853]|uniref:alpha/beta fold hydrolase n=1 Tax=Kitasatospora sp. NPDC051853 TaxID=3364058 RepID=UPI003792925A